MRVPSKIKLLLQINQAWWHYYQNNADTIRTIVVQTIVNLLSCGLTVRGYDEYRCCNPNCRHRKVVSFSCKARFCNTCGNKATEQWIEKQHVILPRTDWQHITFTLASALWSIFRDNRQLLGELSRLAAKTLLKFAKQNGITPGIFNALHGFALRQHHQSLTLMKPIA